MTCKAIKREVTCDFAFDTRSSQTSKRNDSVGSRDDNAEVLFLYSLDFALGGAIGVVRVNVHERINDVFVRIDEQLFDLFGNVMGIFQSHLVIDHDMHVHMQVTPNVAGTEPMQTDDFRVRKCHASKLAQDIGVCATVYKLPKPRSRNFNR